MHNGSSVSSPLVVLSLFAHELDYISFNEANTAKKMRFHSMKPDCNKYSQYVNLGNPSNT